MPSLSAHQSNDFTIEDAVALLNKPILLNEHGCWIWQGQTDKKGYARHGGTLVHGFVWYHLGRACGEGLELCHQCNNRACINPDHLYAGSHLQNMQDAVANGKMGQGPRRVTLEQISLIKTMYSQGMTQREICKIVGVSEAWFTKFKNGELKYAKLG